MKTRLPFFMHNGQIYPQNKHFIDRDNRSFRYGDGLFESMLMLKGNLAFIPKHWLRLQKGMDILKIEYPEYWNENYFLSQITQLNKANGELNSASIRLMVYRSGGGKYGSVSNEAEYVLEMYPLATNQFELNDKGLDIDLFYDIPKPVNLLSEIKHNNCLVYILAKMQAKEKQLDDCLLLNPEGVIIEASSSNLFVVKNGILFTPKLAYGCLDGVMRKTIIELADKMNISVSETLIQIHHLQQADELWLTNAVQGIRWIKQFKQRHYNKAVLAKTFITELNNMFQ